MKRCLCASIVVLLAVVVLSSGCHTRRRTRIINAGATPVVKSDLVLVDLTQDNETFTATVRNDGPGASTPYNVRITLGGETILREFPSLAVNETKVLDPITLPLAECVDTDCEICAIVDSNENDSETDETNNEFCAPIIFPDLVATVDLVNVICPDGSCRGLIGIGVANVPKGITSGDVRLEIKFTVTNAGGGPAAASNAKLNIQLDEELIAKVRSRIAEQEGDLAALQELLDALVTEILQPVDALLPEESQSFTYTSPPNDPIVVLALSACATADSDNTLIETNEENNTGCADKLLPDLTAVVTLFDSDTCDDGCDSLVQFDVTNGGAGPAGPSVVQVVFDGFEGPPVIESRDVPPLAPGASVPIEIRIDTTTNCGACIFVDVSDTVFESGEGNNTTCANDCIP